MKAKRRRHDPAFKAKVALEALREGKTIQQIAKEHDLHPVQVSEWKKTLQERLVLVFENDRHKNQPHDFDQERQQLHSKIGELTVRVDYLQKKCGQLGVSKDSPGSSKRTIPN